MPSSSSCRTKAALFKGFRPNLSNAQQISKTQQILSWACPSVSSSSSSSSCIYCDIWKLATLIASHVPLSARYDLCTGTPVNSPASSAPSSPTASEASIIPFLAASRTMTLPLSRSRSIPYAHLVAACKRIEAQFQTQRCQLNSILSICTVTGADQTEGLRMAHDRCSAAVEDLLDQEEELEESLLRDLDLQAAAEAQNQGVATCDYDYCYCDYRIGYSGHPLSHQRRPSVVNVAI
ncbi:hypothetical protein ABEF95_008105 [Exophiala dermatitidis]